MAKSPNGLIIANPIYREVMPRELASIHQDVLPVNPTWFIRPTKTGPPDSRHPRR